jgi:septal ring factor EnvC (AmiA/AmiB activator)
VVTRARLQADGTASAGSAQNGIEIAAPLGATVAAVHDGTVAFAGPFEGFGHLVILDHGEKSYSLYGHLDEMAVTRGAHVERGRSLGTVGTSPTGMNALYFELRVDGHVVDPLQWLKDRP